MRRMCKWRRGLIAVAAIGGVTLLLVKLLSWYFPDADQIELCAPFVRTDDGSMLRLDDEFCEAPASALVGRDGKTMVTTVRAKLISLGAYCKEGVVYDRWGDRIFFVRAFETGFTVPNMRKINSDLSDRIQKLKVQGTVVLMYRTKIPS